MKQVFLNSSQSGRLGKLGIVLFILGRALLSGGQAPAEAALTLSPSFDIAGTAESGAAVPDGLTRQQFSWGPFVTVGSMLAPGRCRDVSCFGPSNGLAHDHQKVGSGARVNSGRAVPLKSAPALPSTAVLFGSGLIGLFGVVVRRDGLLNRQEVGSGSGTWLNVPSAAVPILFVSHDNVFAKAIEEYLQQAGYLARSVPSVAEVLESASQRPTKLVLIDRRVKDWDILRTDTGLRHVLILTLAPPEEVASEDDVLSDLERGADGVHRCQEGYRLLLARIGAYLRRTGDQPSQRGVYRVGSMELDTDLHEVKIEGRSVRLSAKPFALLETFMRWPAKVFSRSELIDRVWGPEFAIGDHALDVHIHALRQQLDRIPNHLCKLVTIKKVGFKLTSVSPCPSAAVVTSNRSQSPIVTDAVVRLKSSGSRRDGNELPISLSSAMAPKTYVNRLPRGLRARSFRNIRSVRFKSAVCVG